MSKGPKRMRLKKTDRMEMIQDTIKLEYERTDALVTYLKASISAPKFGKRVGSNPFEPVLLKDGARKFRGVPVPEYEREYVEDSKREYTYMGIALQSHASDVCLVKPLGLVSIPTVVHGLADLYIPKNVYDKLKVSSPIYWPDGDKGIRIGKFIQTVIEPSDSLNARIRIVVDSVGDCVIKD